MNRTVAIVQARMGANRMPGKMMLWLHGYPVIEWVVRRTAKARRLDDVVVAIPDTPNDDVLKDFLSSKLRVNVFRGAEQDVLRRFVDAGRQARADRVIRICADNPLVSSEAIDDLIQFFDQNACDYAYNQGDSGRTNTYPDGLGAEMVSYSTLEQVDRQAIDPDHREHCLAYIVKNPDRFDIKTFNPPDQRIAHPELKLDLDDLEDYRRLAGKRFSITDGPVQIVQTFLDEK